MRAKKGGYILSVLTSVAAGLLLSVSIRVNATLGAEIGEVEATLVIHLIGTGFALLVVAPWLNRNFWTQLSQRPSVEYLGGVLSVAMVLVANYVVPVLGTALAVSLFVAGDLFFSTLSDQRGWMDLVQIRVSAQRAVGLLLAFTGVLLIYWG